jgi:hypothetical protein
MHRQVFEDSQLTYSMAYGGMLIPVTQMTWWECSHLLIIMHRRSNQSMILPVGWGWQEGIPSPKISLIIASGHSPLSFASRHWSPQHSILGTQSPHWLATGWSHNPSHTSTILVITRPRLAATAELIWPPTMGAKCSAWTATQLCRIGRFNGSDKL